MSEQAIVQPQSYFGQLENISPVVSSNTTISSGRYFSTVPVNLTSSVTLTLEKAPIGSSLTILVKTSGQSLTFAIVDGSKFNLSLNECAQVMIGATSKTIEAPVAGATFSCISDGFGWHIFGTGVVSDLVTITGSTALSLANCDQLHQISISSDGVNPVLTFPAPMSGARLDFVVALNTGTNTLTFAASPGSAVHGTVLKIVSSNAVASSAVALNMNTGMIVRAISDGSTWYLNTVVA